MGRVSISNVVLGIFNGIILMIGVAVLGLGLYFVIGSHSECEKGINNQLMIIGGALVVVSLLGLIACFYGINLLLMIYLFIMFILIVGFIVFTVFAVMVTNEAAGKAASRVKIKSRSWIRNYFVNDNNWNQIRNCLIDANICKSLGADVHNSLSHFYTNNLSPVQAGCCKPPSECGYRQQNATFWIKPKTSGELRNKDCTTWSNQQQTLCYNCDSCKVGVVQTIRNKWKFLAILNACITVVLALFYSIGCIARRNNSHHTSYSKYAGYTGYRSSYL